MREHRSRWRKLRSCVGLGLAMSVGAFGASVPTALGATPNDPLFQQQWADSNLGQVIPLQKPPGEEITGQAAGTAGADDRALKAWGVTTGSTSIVIGEVDTGVDYNHPDLAANIWSN